MVKRYFVSTALAARAREVSEGSLSLLQLDFAGAAESLGIPVCLSHPVSKAAALGRNCSMGDEVTLQEHPLMLIYQAMN